MRPALQLLVALLGMLGALAQVSPWEMRTFTPRFTTFPPINNEGQRQGITANPSTVSYEDRIGYGYLAGQPFQARLLRIQGEENARSIKYAVLQLPNGVIRGWPVRSFSVADQQYLAQAEATQDATIASSFTPFDGLNVPYSESYVSYRRDDPNVVIEGTEHFLFYWGKPVEGRTLSGQAWYDASFRTRTFRYFEDIWRFNAKELNVTMPWASPDTSEGSGRFKINVYVTGTGLANNPEGFAFGAREIVIHPGAMLEGSHVIAHEFGHVMQYYSKGFRNSDFVGWFWECHGNWIAHQFIPSNTPALEVYMRRRTHELSSTRMNYGSWVFLQVIREDPRFPSSFTTDIWKRNLRRPDHSSLETPFETIRRLARSIGAFKQGDGTEEFGDLIGIVASKMAYFDLVFRQTYRDFLTRFRGSDQLYLVNTPVEPVRDRADWFRPLVSHQPWQYGVNQIPLNLASPRPGFLVVQLNFLMPEAQADWRAALAIESADGSIRYSSKFICQQCSTSQATTQYVAGLDKILFLELKPDDRSAFLTVSASPKTLERLAFRAGFHRKNGYPYEFRVLRGASVPQSTPSWSPRSDPRPAGANHANGGGFVASSARVAPTAFVGPNALILGAAVVSDNARIEDFAIVSDSAVVSGSAVVAGYSWVNGRARISGNAKVRDFSRIHGEVTISEDATVYGQTIISGRGEFRGRSVAQDLTAVVMLDGQIVNGSTVIGRDAEFYSAARPTVKGRFYDFSSEDNNRPQRQTLPESGLFTDYSFNLRRGVVMKDEYSSNDGFIRGRADFATVDNRTCLSFPNSSDPAYGLISGYFLDSSTLSFEFGFKHLRTLSSESVLASLFTNDLSTGIEFGLDATGSFRWTIRANGVSTQILSADRATDASRWYNIRFEMQSTCGGDMCNVTVSSFSGTTRLLLSQSALSMPRSAYSGLSKVSSGMLGRSLISNARFFGWFDHFRVYRRVFGTRAPPAPPGADGTNLVSLNFNIQESQRNAPAAPANLDALISPTAAAPVVSVTPGLRSIHSEDTHTSSEVRTAIIGGAAAGSLAVVAVIAVAVIYSKRGRIPVRGEQPLLL